MPLTSRSVSPAGGLPVDHACALRGAVVNVLPWLEDEPAAGIHSIYGAASGNGWERPGRESGEMISLSRRTRLVLRVPAGRAEATSELCERRLDIDGCEVVTGTRQPRPLRTAGTVFARYVVDEEDGDEERFVERVASALEALSVSARKLLCGRSNRIVSAQRVLTARSLMVAELGAEESPPPPAPGSGG